MKRTSLLLLSIIALVAFTGCGAFKLRVPANTLTFQTERGTLKLSHPQNTDMTNVFVQFNTNGTVTASIGSLHTVNEPAVLTAEAAGEVAKIKATTDMVKTIGETVQNTAGTVAGAAAKKTVAP